MLESGYKTRIDALKRTVIVKFDHVITERPSILDESSIPLYSINNDNLSSKYVYVFDRYIDQLILEYLWDQYPDAVDILSWMDHESIENMILTLDELVYEWEGLIRNLSKYGATYEDIMNILHPIFNGFKFDIHLDTYQRYIDSMDIISYAREYLIRYIHILSIHDDLYIGEQMSDEEFEFLTDVFMYYFIVPSLYSMDLYGTRLDEYVMIRDIGDVYATYTDIVPIVSTDMDSGFMKFTTEIQSRRRTIEDIDRLGHEPLTIESIPVNDLANVIAPLIISSDNILEEVRSKSAIDQYISHISQRLNQSESKIIRRLMEDYEDMLESMQRLVEYLDPEEFKFVRNFLALRFYQGSEDDHRFWGVYTGPVTSKS